jgi:hypothetical protein
MAAFCARGPAAAGPFRWLAAIALAAALVAPAAAQPPEGADAPPPPEAANAIVVMLDEARLMQLPERAANVIVGNPLIADLSIQAGGLTVVTGKSYGATNIIVTDKKGAVLLEKVVEVTGALDPTVVVYRGVDRETYSCTPDCSRRLTLGDAPDFFDKTLGQITTRNAQATAAGTLSSGR